MIIHHEERTMSLPYEYYKKWQNVTQYRLKWVLVTESLSYTGCYSTTFSSVKDTSTFNIQFINMFSRVNSRIGWLYSLFEWRKWNSPSLSYSDYVEEISKRRPHKVEILLIQFQLIPCKTFISLLEKFWNNLKVFKPALKWLWSCQISSWQGFLTRLAISVWQRFVAQF